MSSTYFDSPADPRPGDRFHMAEGCIHSDGEVCWVEPASNAAGKLGHVVIWRDDRGDLYRTHWNAFQRNARRVERPRKENATSLETQPISSGTDAEVAVRLGWVYRPDLKDWENHYPGKYDHLRLVRFEDEPEKKTNWFRPGRPGDFFNWLEGPLPRFSYRLEDAFRIVDQWQGDFELRRQNDQWRASFFRPSEEFERWGDTAPLAICSAFLLIPSTAAEGREGVRP